jgi:hypothetical protein
MSDTPSTGPPADVPPAPPTDAEKALAAAYPDTYKLHEPAKEPRRAEATTKKAG